MPGQREYAGVVLAAQKRGSPVDRELAALAAEFAQARFDDSPVAARWRSQDHRDRVEARVELVPAPGAFAQRQNGFDGCIRRSVEMNRDDDRRWNMGRSRVVGACG